MNTENNKTFSVHDATLSISASTEKKSEARKWPGSDPDWETYNRVKDALRELGFSIYKDPRIEKHHPILSGRHDAGRHGDLEFVCEVYPVGCKFEFFQNVVFENSNGGRYDFDRLKKMPYLVRLRWQHTINALRKHLAGRGFTERVNIRTPNPDPLAYFNDNWDGNYEKKRGIHRFERGPDGWPSDKEIGSWSRADKDGNIVSHGAVRYFRDSKGYLKRGLVYGGINGMWMVIYGPGKTDCCHKHVRELFSCNPSEVSRKVHPRRESVLVAKLKEAVEQENYEKAAVLRDQRDLMAA